MTTDGPKKGRILPGDQGIKSFGPVNEKELWLTRYSIEHASESIFWIKPNGRFIYVNQAASKKLGYTKEELLTLSVEDIDPDYAAGQLVQLGKSVVRLGSTTFRSHHRTKSGRIFPIEVTANRVTYGNENFIFCFIRDVTEKQLAEERLGEIRQRFQVLIENAPFGMAMFDKMGKYLYLNPKFTHIFGYTLKDIPDRTTWFKKAYPDDRMREEALKAWNCDNSTIGIGGKTPRSFSVACKDGSRKFINIITVKHDNGDYIASFEDVTLRRAAEDALANETERLAVTLRSIGDGVIATDRAGRIVLINTVAEELTGWKQHEAIGKNLREVLYIIDERTRLTAENPLDKVLETGKVCVLADHTTLISRQGREMIIADSGAPIRDRNGVVTGVVIVFRDITERKKLDEELQKMSKLESVGILAGGIAHDFNNIMAAVLGNISLARLGVKPGDDEKLLKRLTDAEQAIMRAKDLTYQLLTFSRGGSPIKKTTTIQNVLEEAARFALTGSDVKCQFSFQDDLFSVDIDEGQINQVISNLVINSQQAMPGGGMITVKANNITLDHGMVKNGVFLAKGDYVALSIRDNGVGISPEHVSKVFDPYFTTKPRGSGLGLATSYSIIKNHEGHIAVESKPGHGTTFHIYLPASICKSGKYYQNVSEEIISETTARILHMDDEEMILQTTRDMLENLGYYVETAINGDDAIQKYLRARDGSNPFDVVILDITIPGGMGGKETIQKLLEVDPDVKAIVSSGYSNDPVMAMFGDYGFTGFIAKPYRLDELSDVIKQVLRT
jgi:PAS domain S-box-containing protein